MIRLVVAVVGCALVSRISLQPSGNNRQKVDRIRNTYYYRKKSETTDKRWTGLGIRIIIEKNLKQQTKGGQD